METTNTNHTPHHAIAARAAEEIVSNYIDGDHDLKTVCHEEITVLVTRAIAAAVAEERDYVHGRILHEALVQDGYAHGEILSGNSYKEQAYKSTAAGLRVAAAMLVEQSTGPTTAGAKENV